MSMGSSDNVAYENHIVIHGEDEKYGIYLYRGNDIPGVDGSDGRPRRNRVYGNSIISDNAVVMMRNTDDSIIEVRRKKKNSRYNTWNGLAVNTSFFTKSCFRCLISFPR